MAREPTKIQSQSSTLRILSNQISNNSSHSSSSAASKEMHQKLPDGRWTALLLAIVAALSYATAGTMLGWSNGALRRFDAHQQLLLLTDNWRFSLAATPALVVVVTAFAVHRCYYWVGTKTFLLTGALLAVGSAILEALGRTFWWLSAARILAGIATGITFTLVPSYVDEFCIAKKPLMGDLLAAAFPVGILLRFAADWLVPVVAIPWVTLCWAVVPGCGAVCLLLLPESARFLCATGRVSQAAAVLQRTNALEPDEVQWDASVQAALSRWQLPAPGLLEAVRHQGNLIQLVPLLALFAFQAFVGALPMLFHLTNLLELAGYERAPARAATLLAAVFVAGTLLGRKLLRCPHLHRSLLMAASLVTAGAMFALGWHCHERRTRAVDLIPEPGDWPLLALGLVFAAYAAGFHRQPWALLELEARDENLFALRTLAVAICWGSVYLAVRLLPVLLRTIGVGWLFWNTGLVALFAALLVLVGVPRSDDFAHKTLPTTAGLFSASITSSSSSSSSSPGTPTPAASANCWPRSTATSPSSTVNIPDDSGVNLPLPVAMV
uniref:Major facilitator superfamily (MFS) profile domain-containing protein n=1 Tax=Anopheles atroparvus TaxID=41427 RepID=A0AAG5DV38_ANOAO